MSLYGAMFAGVSGLSAQSAALGIISDNISNVNTTGYKTSKASFSTLVTRQALDSRYAPGGVRQSTVQQIERQGLIEATDNATDLAVVGNGFFVVTDSSSPAATDVRSYTRAGQFHTDDDGYLKSPSGFYLNGWATDSTGTPTATNTSVLSSLEPVRVTSVSASATPTTTIEIGANLPASAAVAATETTNVRIYDSLGVANDVTFTWTKAAANTWTATAAVPTAGTVEEGTVGSGTPFSVTIAFNTDGTPASFDGASTVPDLALGTLSSGAADMTVSLDWGTANSADGLTQFSSTYATAFVNQNGVQFGKFYGTTIDEDGIVSVLFDNGETLKIYKVPLATFSNPNGLEAKTGTVFNQSSESGGYLLRSAGDANTGQIAPSSLESSTTDLAGEFTNMIITQRAYSAATRIITTADEMLDELIRVKR